MTPLQQAIIDRIQECKGILDRDLFRDPVLMIHCPEPRTLSRCEKYIWQAVDMLVHNGGVAEFQYFLPQPDLTISSRLIRLYAPKGTRAALPIPTQS